MADDDDKPEEITDVTEEAAPAQDDWPDTGGGDAEPVEESVWMRGLWMVILAILFGFAELILGIFAVLQFLWMLFAKEKNSFIRDAGQTIGKWLHAVALFQTGASEDKPFPWRKLD
jgi:hypothetical protein